MTFKMRSALFLTLTWLYMAHPLQASHLSSNTEPIRALNLEDLQWVADLQGHRGYQLVRARMEELLVSYQHKVLRAEAPEVYRLQGSIIAMQKALEIPRELKPRTTGEII